jgi:hypothetical protein
METTILSMRKSSGDLNKLQVPEFVLNGSTTYYWTATVADINDNESDPADAFSFTTKAGTANYEDTDHDGIPDAQEVSDADFNAAFTNLATAWRVNTANGNAIQALEGVVGIQSFVSLKAISSSDIPSVEGFEFPQGFVATSMTCDVGATVTVKVHLSKAAGSDAKWYFYNQVTNIISVYTGAVFSSDRKAVTLTLTDGGAGDADGEANGCILDPAGFGVPKTTSGEGAGDDNCFIATAAGGNGPNVAGPVYPLMILLMTLIAGSVTFCLKKVRK